MEYLYIPFLSVILGFVFALLVKPKEKKNIKLVLAFSGSFLLSITVLHLLPELYEAHQHDEHHHTGAVGLYIMLGIVFQIVLEFFSKGAEHGHVHGSDSSRHMPWILFVSLCLHALFEGMPVSHHHDLSWGIGIHHFPIAIILTTFFMNSGLPKKIIIGFMIGFAMMTPLGTILSERLPLLMEFHTEITAIVVGILFHISSTIIFETNEGHKFNFLKLSVILFGLLLAYFI